MRSVRMDMRVGIVRRARTPGALAGQAGQARVRRSS
jgi:hypothetical protein